MGIYQRKDSPFWWYSFKLPAKGRFTGSTDTADRKLAMQIYIGKRSESQKVHHGFEKPRTKLSLLFEDYMNLHAKNSKRTWKSNELVLARLTGYFGDVRVEEITPMRVEQYRSWRMTHGSRVHRVSKSTINREMALLKHVFNKGIEWGKCADNPVSKIKFYSEKENKRMRYLESHEKVRLLNACPPATRRLVFFALNTGMRQGEILNLRWQDVDFKNQLVMVRHSKAGKPRFVNINTELTDTLKRMPTVSDYVFGTPKGRANFTLYRKPFETAVKTAGLGNFRFHDLRHDYASTLVMKGIDLKTVSELLGHATTQMTERYSHLSPAHKRAAVELLPQGLMCYAGATLEPKPDQSTPIYRRRGLVAQLAEQATLNR